MLLRVLSIYVLRAVGLGQAFRSIPRVLRRGIEVYEIDPDAV